MPNATQIDVKDLKLDLKNFRTVPQKDEADAVNAMISISDERFWALMLSLIEDGYITTENIIAIKSGKDIIVKEGNRRIAGLKLIHGYLDPNDFNLSPVIISKIAAIPATWKTENLQVPCIVYDGGDIKTVDKIVNLTHGKGDKASRDKWPSIATARHNRDMNKASEPGLDLLEKYFKQGKNITDEQKEKWSGDYYITVLDEALKKIAFRIDEPSAIDVAKNYPSIKFRDAVEKIISNIGLKNIGFKEVRNVIDDFAEKYGIPLSKPAGQAAGNTSTGTTTSNANASNANSNGNTGANTQPNGRQGTASSTGNNQAAATTNTTTAATGNTTLSFNANSSSNTKAYAINDPRGITKLLKAFNPSGLNRQKVVTLKDEALKLKLKQNPIAFCFLLRSMFEISVKAYFIDHHFNAIKVGGKDKTLKEMLNEAKNHLTNNGQNNTLNKELHGAITELNKTAGILSVTSMNQLVHNPTFSVTESDVCTLFVQIFPLLKALN